MHHVTTHVPAPVTVIWDWNGTLRDDIQDHLDALNATLPDLGRDPITLDRYRAEHRTPIRAFYDRTAAATARRAPPGSSTDPAPPDSTGEPHHRRDRTAPRH